MFLLEIITLPQHQIHLQKRDKTPSHLFQSQSAHLQHQFLLTLHHEDWIKAELVDYYSDYQCLMAAR